MFEEEDLNGIDCFFNADLIQSKWSALYVRTPQNVHWSHGFCLEFEISKKEISEGIPHLMISAD